MSDSTSNLDLLPAGGNGQEVRANALFDALGFGAGAGRRASLSTALTWAYYGTPRYYINGVATAFANGTRSLTASSTRFVSLSRAMAVTEVATAFDADKLAMAKVTTSASAVTAYEDHRDPKHLIRFLEGKVVQAMGAANKTLTYEQAMCDTVELTGASAALLDVVVPTIQRTYIIFANTSGGGGIRVKTAAGTGITVADGKRAIVQCDSVNVVRVTADV